MELIGRTERNKMETDESVFRVEVLAPYPYENHVHKFANSNKKNWTRLTETHLIVPFGSVLVPASTTLMFMAPILHVNHLTCAYYDSC